MDIIGRKKEVLPDPSLLAPLALQGRPQEYPKVAGQCVIFGYQKDFGYGGESDVDEALVACESLEDMQTCYDRFNGKTPFAWYLAAGPGEPQLVPVTMAEIDIQADFDE